jgi:hypothetical protein
LQGGRAEGNADALTHLPQRRRRAVSRTSSGSPPGFLSSLHSCAGFAAIKYGGPRLSCGDSISPFSPREKRAPVHRLPRLEWYPPSSCAPSARVACFSVRVGVPTPGSSITSVVSAPVAWSLMPVASGRASKSRRGKSSSGWAAGLCCSSGHDVVTYSGAACAVRAYPSICRTAVLQRRGRRLLGESSQSRRLRGFGFGFMTRAASAVIQASHAGFRTQATPTGMGTVTVTDNYGTGPDRTNTWSSCNDEYHVFPGDADPCAMPSGN